MYTCLSQSSSTPTFCIVKNCFRFVWVNDCVFQFLDLWPCTQRQRRWCHCGCSLAALWAPSHEKAVCWAKWNYFQSGSHPHESPTSSVGGYLWQAGTYYYMFAHWTTLSGHVYCIFETRASISQHPRLEEIIKCRNNMLHEQYRRYDGKLLTTNLSEQKKQYFSRSCSSTT